MLAILAIPLVVCAPGYPGSTAEAQASMDALARTLAASARLSAAPLAAVYEATVPGCLRRLAEKDAALLVSTLPFYLEHEQDLRLVPRLMAAPKDGEPLERWTLVTGKDHPPSLAGYTVQSSAGYSPRFVRAAAPGLPADVEIVASSAVLSALRRAANGEKLAVLLDGSQSAALGKLPFSASLAVVETSPPIPVPVIATVDKRTDERQSKTLQAALTALYGEPSAREALDGVRVSAFVPVDAKALAAAQAAYRRARWEGGNSSPSFSRPPRPPRGSPPPPDPPPPPPRAPRLH